VRSTSLLGIDKGDRKYPAPAIDMNTTPKPAVPIAAKSSGERALLPIRRTGLYTKRNGIIKPGAAIIIDCQATWIGFACAIPAAVNEAIATGGVIFERQEK
jgi:hypothetical protein